MVLVAGEDAACASCEAGEALYPYGTRWLCQTCHERLPYWAQLDALRQGADAPGTR